MTGYSIVEPAAVLATHLTEVIRTHAQELLGRRVQQLIDNLRQRNQVLVTELTEVSGVKIGVIQKYYRDCCGSESPSGIWS